MIGQFTMHSMQFGNATRDLQLRRATEGVRPHPSAAVASMPTSLMTLLGSAPMVSLRLSSSEASPPTGSVTVKARDSSRRDDGRALQIQQCKCLWPALETHLPEAFGHRLPQGAASAMLLVIKVKHSSQDEV